MELIFIRVMQREVCASLNGVLNLIVYGRGKAISLVVLAQQSKSSTVAINGGVSHL